MYSQLIKLGINIVKDKHTYQINKMDSYQESISKLKFIGKIKKGEKINTRQLYVQQEGIVTSISRTFWNQDNRTNTINFIQDTINRGFEILEKYDKSQIESEKNLALNLITDLRKVNIGLLNLKFTYSLDTKFCCDIDAIVETIVARLHCFKDKYEEDIDLNDSDS